ncbi:glycosyltransferase family 39 protein [Asticcacaulis sp. EMRT-3]|uniref:ArnT family glycosyltransferase n=1 Tax=Asticcacaulis sp. EMRT-3 TaxID=3040349 RepID=UPI0024AF1A5B|nr:glycosyltransferase family 39 protein [Asticcacaulis sp. EMRT-3]MDI7776256.1 glycosyltransferase family 39 protein [Asticcacaulis sp. EMRT-3]
MPFSSTASARQNEDFCLLAHLRPHAFFKALSRGETIIWLLTLSLFLHLFLAAVVPLTADEAYAVVVSRSHALSYYDHPPLAFAMARVMADLTGHETPFITRLPFVLMGTGSAILLFDITRRLYGAQAARWATAAFCLSPFFFSFAQGLIMPDGPLDFFLLLSFWLIQPVLFMNRESLLSWPAAGMALALAMMSKYQAVLFAVAALLALILTPQGRRQFKRPGLWIGLGLAFLGALPVIIWNAHHGWASFAFQTGRAYHHTSLIGHLGNGLAVLAGQALYLMPVTWLACQRQIVLALKSPKMEPAFLLAVLAIVPIVVFDVIALTGRHSLPHWTMSGFLFALPLVGRVRARMSGQGRFLRLKLAGCVVGAAGLVLAAQAQFDLTALLPKPLHRTDLGWQNLPWRALDGQVPGADRFIVTPDWVSAGQAGLALGPDYPLRVLSDAHQFQFMDQGRLKTMRDGYYVQAVPVGGRADMSALQQTYRLDGPARILPQFHVGHAAFDLVIAPVSLK